MKEKKARPIGIILRFRRVLSLVAQLGLVVISNRIAFALRFDRASPGWAVEVFWHTLPWLVAIRALTFFPFKLYEGLWRYTSLYDLQALVGGIVTSSLLFVAFVHSGFGPASYPRSVYVIDPIILTLLLGGLRLARRYWGSSSASSPDAGSWSLAPATRGSSSSAT